MKFFEENLAVMMKEGRKSKERQKWNTENALNKFTYVFYKYISEKGILCTINVNAKWE